MEAQLFEPGTIPDFTTASWYESRARAPHLEQEPHASRLRKTAEHVRDAIDFYDLATVVDLGSGDGGLLSLLDGIPCWGYDLQQSNVSGAVERAVDVRLGDILTGDLQWGDVAVATEVVEHLLDPSAFLQRVHAHSSVVVASSPWTETADSHYAFHAWAWDQDGYSDLFARNGWSVTRVDLVDMFQVITAVHSS